jgi:hypothetical protein
MNQPQDAEILIRSWDDPTLQYSVKDAETFHRVYGDHSRFYIASGPDMDAGLKAYYEALTPHLPNQEADGSDEFVEQGDVQTEDAPPVSEAPVQEAAPETGSPEF